VSETPAYLQLQSGLPSLRVLKNREKRKKRVNGQDIAEQKKRNSFCMHGYGLWLQSPIFVVLIIAFLRKRLSYTSEKQSAL
jgi:hypothetical protein